MQSLQSVVPSASLGAALKPWQKIDWSPEGEYRIYKSWGDYYTRRRRENFALYYYNKALNIVQRDFMTLYHRSQSKRKAAKTEEALKDGLAAAVLAAKQNNGQKFSTINLEVCDALFELNQFENALAELHSNKRNFVGNKTKCFEKRLDVVNESMNEALHESVGPFILENEQLIEQIVKKIKEEKNVDKRPLWKILKDKDLCDVVSVQEHEEVVLSPLEIARRKRAFDVFNQSYIYRPWADVLFLKNLRKNPNLMLPMCPDSSPYIKKLINREYDVVIKFLKMLHARAPMYFLNSFQRNHEPFLNRTQFQTRRNMTSVLRCIRLLKDTGNYKKLAKYVEEVMGDYVTIKTCRVMPWKFEFLNEVYDTLALAYAETYRVPSVIKSLDQQMLATLLNMPKSKPKDVMKFVFGDRTTYQGKDLTDPTCNPTRQFINRLEKRLVFSKYNIEKAYLYHTLALTYFDQNKYDECCFSARKSIEAAKSCNSHIWNFLSHMLIVKSHASLMKVERCKETLEAALMVTLDLKCTELTTFVEACLFCNTEELLKKSVKSVHSSVRHSTASYMDVQSGSIEWRKSSLN